MFNMRVCVWGQDEFSDRWTLQHEFLPPTPEGTGKRKNKSTSHAHVLFLGGRHYDTVTLKEEVARKL
jgi:hypothetical protein